MLSIASSLALVEFCETLVVGYAKTFMGKVEIRQAITPVQVILCIFTTLLNVAINSVEQDFGSKLN